MHSQQGHSASIETEPDEQWLTEEPVSIQRPVGDVELDFWGSNIATHEIIISGGNHQVEAALVQLDGPEDAFIVTKRSPPVESLGHDDNIAFFDIQAGPNGIMPGTYNFEARATDDTSSDVVIFQVHQQQIKTLWNSNVIQAEDSNFGNGYGITELSDLLNGNFNSYRNDGLDVSRTCDGATTYLSHTQSGERTSYTLWTPAGEHILRVMAATDSSTDRGVDVYVDGVYQDTAVISKQNDTSEPGWEEFKPVDVKVNLNGYYETIEFRFVDGGVNIDSFWLLETTTSYPADATENLIRSIENEQAYEGAVGASNMLHGDTTCADETSPSGVLVAINAGGPALFEDGVNYISDVDGLAKDWLTGTTSTFHDSVGPGGPNGSQQFIGTTAESERWNVPHADGFGSFGYAIPEEVLGGNLGQTFDVEIDFAEIYFSGQGERIFDVMVEGQIVMDDFDINAVTDQDYNSIVTMRFEGFRASDFGDPSMLEIHFFSGAAVGGVNHAKVNAIRVLEGGAPLSPGSNGFDACTASAL